MQEKLMKRIKSLIGILNLLILTISVQGQIVTSQTYPLMSGELILKQEILINANVERIWKAFTVAEEWMQWVTPVVEMDFRINGTIKSHYDSTAKIGDKGTIVIHILVYIPEEQILMQAEMTENFPDFIKAEEKNLYSIFKFEKVDKNRTKVILYGIGYKNEKKWQDLLKFFIQGNESTLVNLKKYVEEDGSN
jgi:uncharacterized protein YndB with AHSA1/START domain